MVQGNKLLGLDLFISRLGDQGLEELSTVFEMFVICVPVLLLKGSIEHLIFLCSVLRHGSYLVTVE
jgi:hypothetical protein